MILRKKNRLEKKKSSERVNLNGCDLNCVFIKYYAKNMDQPDIFQSPARDCPLQ